MLRFHLNSVHFLLLFQGAVRFHFFPSVITLLLLHTRFRLREFNGSGIFIELSMLVGNFQHLIQLQYTFTFTSLHINFGPNLTDRTSQQWHVVTVFGSACLGRVCRRRFTHQQLTLGRLYMTPRCRPSSSSSSTHTFPTHYLNLSVSHESYFFAIKPRQLSLTPIRALSATGCTRTLRIQWPVNHRFFGTSLCHIAKLLHPSNKHHAAILPLSHCSPSPLHAPYPEGQ